MIKRSCFATLSAVFLLIATSVAVGQRPRVMPDDPGPSSTATPPAAPATVKAKYEGGVFGYPHKKTGTLSIDIPNSRITFRDGKQKELFSIPFGSITGAYGDSHSVRPAAATVISHVLFTEFRQALSKPRFATSQANSMIPTARLWASRAFASITKRSWNPLCIRWQRRLD